MLDDTVIVVTSDHGENLGDHDGLLGHAFSVHQTLVHVPLVIRYPPRFPEGERNPELVSTMSLFPTLLELAGTQPDPAWPPAAPSIPTEPGRPGSPYVVSEYGFPAFELYLLVSQVPGVDISAYAVRQTAIQSPDWKLITCSDGRSELFHLSEDPDELVPITGRGEAEAALAERLDAYRREYPPPVLRTPRALLPMDEQTLEVLRSLGYVQ